MITQEQKQDIERLENTARSWNLISVASFAGAALVGLVKTANDIRHKFYQSYVIGYDGQKTIFSAIRNSAKADFEDNLTNFNSGKKTIGQFANDERVIANQLDSDIKILMKQRIGISTQNVLTDWTVGSWQRLKLLGRTNRLDAAMGFAGTATIALGAIAVLKHSSRILDAINQKIQSKETEHSGR
jgi:hypothetical protein